MELTMGTPISNTAQRVVEDFCLYGKIPSHDDRRSLGIDMRLLQQRHLQLKEHISQIEGYVNLQEACFGLYTRERVKTWDVLVEEAKLTKQRVLRLTTEPDRNNRVWPLFQFGFEYDVEVFLTRTGSWIVWEGGNGISSASHFTRFHRVWDIVIRLRSIPERNYGEIEESIIPLLHKNLSRILEASIAAKEDRLAPLKELLLNFNESDLRNGIQE